MIPTHLDALTLLERARAGATRAHLEAEGYARQEIEAAFAKVLQERLSSARTTEGPA